MLHFPELEQFGLVAALSDRADGDCGWKGGHQADRDGFLTALGLRRASLRVPRQVHGNRVCLLRSADEVEAVRNLEADALATADPGLVLGVTVADCVPVYLFSPAPRAVAVVHAGREGTYNRIASVAVQALVDGTGATAADMRAVVGPSAGPCCYEVSPEMASHYRDEGFPVLGRSLDLWEANRRQLLLAGLAARNIHVSGICTVCSDRFHSLRGSGTEARNLAVISLR